MKPPRNVLLTACLAAALASTIVGGSAEDTSSPPAPPEFRFFNSTEFISERGEVQNCIVLAYRSRFTFLPPGGWSFQARIREQSVVFSSPDPGLVLSIRFYPAITNLPPVEKSAEWLEWLKSEQSEEGFEFKARGPVHSDASTGIAFDVERAIAGRPRLLRRMAFFPSPLGFIRIELAGLPEGVEANTHVLGVFLTSLRMQAEVPKKARKETQPEPAAPSP